MKISTVIAGLLSGAIGAMGMGGGGVLLIYLTAFAGMSQHQAQGINLLSFLPAAAASLPAHQKNGLLARQPILPAILAGLAAAAATALLSNSLDTRLLKKLFGVFLLYIGLRELFRRDKKSPPTRK